jgi:hypothetical protein
MWLENEKVREIDTAVYTGERGKLHRVFSELFGSEGNPREVLTQCPTCHKPLVRKSLSYLEYLVNACPDRHGVWMSPEVSVKLKNFVKEQIATKAKKQKLILSAGILILVILISGLSENNFWKALVKSWFGKLSDKAISADYWPMRSFERFNPLPPEIPALQTREELNYFRDMITLLEGAASNRMNLDAVLKTNRPEEEFLDIFKIYQENHLIFMDKWKRMPLPDKLRRFHAEVLVAAEAELVFYTDFMRKKIEDEKVDMGRLMRHPSREESNLRLVKAFSILRQTYPELDEQSAEAVETRLCWFDIV